VDEESDQEQTEKQEWRREEVSRGDKPEIGTGDAWGQDIRPAGLWRQGTAGPAPFGVDADRHEDGIITSVETRFASWPRFAQPYLNTGPVTGLKQACAVARVRKKCGGVKSECVWFENLASGAKL